MRRPTSDQTTRRRAVIVVAALVILLAGGLIVASQIGGGQADVDAQVVATTTTEPASSSTEGIESAAPSTTTPTGRFVASLGTGGVVGDGPLRTYRVEVEEGTGMDADEFADQVEVILSSEQGWTTADGISLQRVAADADIVVSLATPPTVDLLCAPLKTQSLVSCAQEQRAIINLDRWLLGAEPSQLDIPTYRGYLISHEFGHTLGHKHVDCPAAGAPAPVMMQQTHSIGACAPNPWPVPIEDRRGG